MKKYRLKIPFYDMGIKYEVDDLLMEDSDKYAIDSSNRFFRKDFVENNPDIFEKVEEEPKYEVGDWVKLNDNNYVVQIDLIGNNDEILLKFSGDKVSWVHESQIKCKVKPVTLWGNIYKVEGIYETPYLHLSEEGAKMRIDKTRNYISTHSITIYEEVEE